MASKTIISFDIGIKNLAYCIFTLSDNKLHINAWGIANLLSNETPQNVITCNCAKVKNGLCGKKAVFTCNNNAYCKMHAEKSGFYLPAAIKAAKKMKIDELREFLIAPATLKKPELLDLLNSKSLVPIKVVKQNANKVHLVSIGKQLKTQLNAVLSNMPKIDTVILENQISPIAGRMNTIQGMCAQYFIMAADKDNNIPDIEFISSAGKLKDFAVSETNTYKDHKRDSIRICLQMLDANGFSKEAIETSDKKDDLADCFLQGIYFMKKNKYINYSEDLEINSVSL